MVAATQLASSASMCWIAWKVEIGLPNCTLCLEYSVAVARTLSAAPAICMARITAASSNALSALTNDPPLNSTAALSKVTVP